MKRIDTLLSFLKRSPHDCFLRHALALEYIKIGNDRDARLLFESLLEDDPQYVGSYYQLAKLLERNGEIGKALACYEKGMTMAKSLSDTRAYGELKAAYEELKY